MTAVPTDQTAVHLQVEPSSMKRDPILIGLWITLVIVALVWVAPFVFIVFTSLKTPAAVTGTGAFVPPTELAFENYSAAWPVRSRRAPSLPRCCGSAGCIVG